MPEAFKQHLQKFTAVTDEDYPKILEYFEVLAVGKKENLLTAGQLCNRHFFVARGCLRKFFITDKGTEQTTEFAIENWWLTDNIAYERQLPTDFYIQAVEKSEVLAITHDRQEALLHDFPQMERYFRFVYQRAYAASQMRIKYLYDYSREELYFHFVEKHPDFVQRVPQYLMASFLGFTPEYLSEIRAKKRS